MAIVVCLLSTAIAMRTTFNRHPDEIVHLDAFCYFEEHYWPPLPDSEGLLYIPDGSSRVFNGEVVYWLWGRMGALVAPTIKFSQITLTASGVLPRENFDAQSSFVFLPLIIKTYGCQTIVQLYRLFNTGLLALTLFVLLYFGRQDAWLLMLAATLLCIPQVIYVYSYANSDAWGLSMSAFLFAFAVVQRKPLSSLRATLLLGLLTALVLLSKQPYWLTLPFAYLWMVVGESQRQPHTWWLSVQKRASRVTLLVVTVFVLVAPFKILPQFSISDYQPRVVQMLETRAVEGRRPSNPTYPGFHLAARGAPFAKIWRDPAWYQSTATSLYGKFGYMSEALAPAQYLTIAALFMMAVASTYGFAVVRYKQLASATKLALWVAPLFTGLNLFTSLYHSWTFDFQPQGRYLFPSIIPLTLMMAGTYFVEPRGWQRVRAAGWLVACGLCLYTLYRYVLINPNLLS